ncbi:MAG: YraN family protein, partial [Clostridia bacterium]|nr:YraN family protein [Clostridia bacterium]
MFGLNTKNIGNKGEDIAAAYLKRKGYKIVDRNVYIAGGELDIVAVDNNILVFVEVKMRNNNSYGSPLESITPD